MLPSTTLTRTVERSLQGARYAKSLIRQYKHFLEQRLIDLLTGLHTAMRASMEKAKPKLTLCLKVLLLIALKLAQAKACNKFMLIYLAVCIILREKSDRKIFQKMGEEENAVNYWNKLAKNPDFKDIAKKHLQFLGGER